MTRRTTFPRRASIPGFGLLAVLIVVIPVLAGCDTALNALADSDRPTDVSATDGEYGDRIVISWMAPNVSADDGEEDDGEEEANLVGYDIFRAPSDGGTSAKLNGNLVDPDDTSYVDSGLGLQQGVPYEYTVRAVFSDTDVGGESLPDTGYAITARDIQVGSTLGRYERAYDTSSAPTSAGGKVWFRFPAQQGWEYEVQVESTTTDSTDVRLLSEKELEPAPDTSSEAGSIFTAERSGLHYVELAGGSGTVSVRYLGAQ
ncbi:MAG: fibronectin type III domain-containing protein [Alkalispirochaeta sp.]